MGQSWFQILRCQSLGVWSGAISWSLSALSCGRGCTEPAIRVVCEVNMPVSDAAAFVLSPSPQAAVWQLTCDPGVPGMWSGHFLSCPTRPVLLDGMMGQEITSLRHPVPSAATAS